MEINKSLTHFVETDVLKSGETIPVRQGEVVGMTEKFFEFKTISNGKSEFTSCEHENCIHGVTVVYTVKNNEAIKKTYRYICELKGSKCGLKLKISA